MNVKTSAATENEMENSSKDAGNESVDDSILVFQCENCKRILGDSTSWICADETLKIITLEYVTKDVKVVDRLKSSTNCGSAFVPLCCKGCNECIGRVYKTTTSHLDLIRDKYSLLVPKISSYEVGRFRDTNVDYEVKPSKLTQLQDDIAKIQSVIVNMNARLAALESLYIYPKE